MKYIPRRTAALLFVPILLLIAGSTHLPGIPAYPDVTANAYPASRAEEKTVPSILDKEWEWPRTTPEEQGLNSTKLLELADLIRG